MEVILKQDIPNVGYIDEIVNVKPGYARNYLIPKGMAILATDTAKKIHAEKEKQQAFKADKIIQEAKDFAKKLENLKVKIGAKAAESGKIYGSVNAIQIAQAIKDQHDIEVDRKRIMVDQEHIKELGTYKATINLHKEVGVEIEFEVVAD
jgi:large subunit ribosomal protein L9